MAERYNGNVPFKRTTHGSSRRGVISVPSQDYLTQLRQSQEEKRNNKEQLLLALRNRVSPQQTEPPQSYGPEPYTGLGNPSLPIFKYKEDLMGTIAVNKAVILEGATGSGKSTQLPQFLVEDGYDHVFALEPRRIMADGLTDRIRSELADKSAFFNTEPGKPPRVVGVVHGERHDRHPDDKITYMTPMTFIRSAKDIQKEFAGRRLAGVPDEIHEDDPMTEFAIGVLAMMVSKNPEWRFVGASATINADTIKKSLGRITNFEHPETVDVPVFKVEGRPFDVEMHEEPDMNPAEAYLAYGLEHAVSILSTRGKAQIRNIETVVRMGLEAKRRGSSEDYIFRELSAGTTDFQRQRLIEFAENVPEGKHLVVVASPAARSGVTIPNATFAATDGMINREIRNEYGHWGLQTKYLSQAEIIQIIGRVGRDVPGGIGYICAPMPRDILPRRVQEHKVIYPFKTMTDRERYPTPAIFNTNISGMVLQAADIDIDYAELNNYTLHQVDSGTISNAKRRLAGTFGALDDEGKITKLGSMMNRFPVVSELSRGIAEGLLRGRSRQHMARLALTAAAVDVGGLQEFRGNAGQEWKQLLSGEAYDDFIAQLDIMLRLRENDSESKSSREKYLFARAYDLNPKKVEDAQKLAGKILRRLHIDSKQFEIEEPNYLEVKDLREDFTSGMFDSVYRDDGVREKERVFTHVREKESSTNRTISKRSVTEPVKGLIVAGIPQYYEDVKGTTVNLKDVLTMTLKVDPEVVGRFALQNHLVTYEAIKDSSRMNGGMVVERETINFGSLRLGTQDVSKSREQIPLHSQKKLVDNALINPGDLQRELRKTADELAEYRRLLPDDILATYRQPKAPVDLTKHEIHQLLKHYAARTRNMQELDALLGEHAHQKGIAIDRFYDSKARIAIIERSPTTILIGGVETTVQYDNGKPYITRITKAQEAATTAPVFLEDGREVLHQVGKAGGRGTVRISFGETLEA